MEEDGTYLVFIASGRQGGRVEATAETAAEEEVIVTSVLPDERAFFGLRRCGVESDLLRRSRGALEVASEVNLVQVALYILCQRGIPCETGLLTQKEPSQRRRQKHINMRQC